MKGSLRLLDIALVVTFTYFPIHGHENTLEDVVQFENPAAEGEVPHVHEATGDASRFNRKHVQNQEHILEHLNGVIDKPEVEMSDEELQFHYFKLHDYDQNTKLDGIEIIDAMTHYHKGEAEGHSPPPRMPDEELISVVDQIMEDEDFNRDGYIDYSEFVAAQRATDGPTKI